MLDEFAEYTVGPLRNGLHYLGTGSVELPYIGHTAAIAISALFVALPHFSATSKDHSLLAACVFVMQAFASATVSSLLLGVPNTVLVHSAAVIVSIAMWIVFSSSSIFSRILLSTPASHVLRALGAANTAVGITMFGVDVAINHFGHQVMPAVIMAVVGGACGGMLHAFVGLLWSAQPENHGKPFPTHMQPDYSLSLQRKAALLGFLYYLSRMLVLQGSLQISVNDLVVLVFVILWLLEMLAAAAPAAPQPKEKDN